MAGVAAFVTVRLLQELELVGRLAAGASLVEDSFRFGTNVFYQAPPVAASASLGVGWRSE
jgi:hypothetical protein